MAQTLPEDTKQENTEQPTTTGEEIVERVDSTDSLPDTTKDDDRKEDDGKRAAMPEHPLLYAPITRIDKEKREVECVVTSEALDSYKTIFSYEGSKRAFQKWVERTANVREMHDRKAVAKGVGVVFDDDEKKIWLRSRISRGAPDTWLKIEDDVLVGYSVGASNPVWGQIERDGKTYPYLLDYELTEVSLVDNPSNPDALGLSICRADGLTDLIDVTEPEVVSPPTPTPEPATAPPEPETVERAGARISASTRDQLHGTIKSLQQTCGCADCQSALGGDDADAEQDNPDETAERFAERVITLVAQSLHTPITRMHAIAGTFARSHAPEIDFSPIERSLETIVSRLETVPTQSSLDEVRTSLEVVKGQVEVIARQPASGGPILNGARPVEKTLATDPRSSQYLPQQQESTLDVLNRLQQMGAFDTIDKQVAAAALAAQPTYGRNG